MRLTSDVRPADTAPRCGCDWPGQELARGARRGRERDLEPLFAAFRTCVRWADRTVSRGRSAGRSGEQEAGVAWRRPRRRGAWRGGGAERSAGGGAERTHIPGAAFVGWSRRVRFTPRRRGPAVEVSNREISGLNVISQYARNLVITKDMILAKDPNRIDAQSLRDHGGIMRTRRFDTPAGYLTIFRGRAGEREDGWRAASAAKAASGKG
jgi:hypothetical protein